MVGAIYKGDLSRRRRTRRKKKFWFILVSTIVFVVGLVLVLRLSTLNISNIVVIGAGAEETSIIEKVGNIINGNYYLVVPRRNIFLYPKTELERAILNLSPVYQSVRVSALFGGKLTISITSRAMQALWCRVESECYSLDPYGLVFSRVSSTTEGVGYYGIIEGEPLGQRFGKEDYLSSLSNFVSGVESLGLEPVSVSIVSDQEGRVLTSVGLPISFPPYGDKVALLENLRLFLEDARERNGGTLPKYQYIDARYGNKIFYKLGEEI